MMSVEESEIKMCLIIVLFLSRLKFDQPLSILCPRLLSCFVVSMDSKLVSGPSLDVLFQGGGGTL